MGQKVHPIGFRLGITTQHTSNWYAEKSQYTENLLKDIEVREHLEKKLSHASVSRITEHIDSYAGKILIEEVNFIKMLTSNAKKPVTEVGDPS